MDRFVLVARLKPGGRQRAEELLAEHAVLEGPELEGAFERHSIFLSEGEVVFFLEGEGADKSARAFFNDPVESTLVSRWLPLFDGPLHRAREVYFWSRER